MTLCDVMQYWGYSEKIGPVFLNDREEDLSASKREEVEGEVRRWGSSTLVLWSSRS
jgi:hypothetical protein